MASIHPAIEKMADGHHLGTAEQLFTHMGRLVVLWCMIVVYGLGGILSGLAGLGGLLSGQYDAGGPFLVCLVFLVFLCLFYWITKTTRAAPYYCLCTEGFLELKPGDPPKMTHAVRWDAISSVRKAVSGFGRSRRTTYWVRLRQGKEIQIWDSGIWDYCNEHVYARTGNYA